MRNNPPKHEKTAIQILRMNKGRKEARMREKEKIELQQYQKGIQEYLKGESI